MRSVADIVQARCFRNDGFLLSADGETEGLRPAAYSGRRLLLAGPFSQTSSVMRVCTLGRTPTACRVHVELQLDGLTDSGPLNDLGPEERRGDLTNQLRNMFSALSTRHERPVHTCPGWKMKIILQTDKL